MEPKFSIRKTTDKPVTYSLWVKNGYDRNIWSVSKKIVDDPDAMRAIMSAFFVGADMMRDEMLKQSPKIIGEFMSVWEKEE